VTDLPWGWIAFGTTVLAAVFASLFHAVRDLSRTTLEDLIARRGPTRASRWAELILEDLEGHANGVALPRVLFSLASGFAIIAWVLKGRGGGLDDPAGLVLGLIGATLVVWIAGVAIPHGVARHAGAATIHAFSWAIRACAITCRPFVLIVNFVDEVVRRLTGRADRPAEHFQAELLSVVETGQAEGQVDDFERDMIESVVRFKEKTVQQIMTPRTEMQAMELTNNLGEVTQIIRRFGHSRIPVYEQSHDKIVGVFYVKDLMRWLAGEGRTGKSFVFRNILRPALFVPETKTIRELLSELIEKKVHIAMVADEYGGVAGLVTIEDILEEIVGEIKDEYEVAEEEEVEPQIDREARAATIDARVYIDDANDALLPLAVEIPKSDDYDTVGGFVTVSCGRIPAQGEQVRVGDLLITVIAAEPTRVTRVRVEAASPATPEPPELPPPSDIVTTPANDQVRAAK
jgi:putative hemolysin